MSEGQGYPAAANTQPRGEAALLTVIRRALDGDPFPVSGGRSEQARFAPHPNPLPAGGERGLAVPYDRAGEDGAAYPFSPQAGRRWRQPDEGHPPALQKSEQPFSDRIRGILQYGEEAAPVPAAAAPVPDKPAIDIEPETPQAAIPHAEPLLPPAAAPAHRFADEAPTPVSNPDVLRWADIFRPASLAFVAVATVLGAAVPAFLTESPPRFAAEARLETHADAPPGWIDAVARRVTSPHSLAQAVAKLKLDRDPEFTGGDGGALAVAAELFSGGGDASAPSRAQASLRKAVAVNADGRAGALRLSVTTGDGEKSARIANLLADAAVYDATIADDAGTAATSASRAAYDRATAALDAFSYENGADRIKAALEMQKQRDDLKTAVAAAEKAATAAKAKLAAAKAAKLSDVLEGALDEAVSSPALEDLRQKYVAAKATLSQLSVDLGPRHPRLIAQKATVDGLTAGMQAELRRLAGATDVELAAATADQKRLSDRLSALDRQSGGVDMTRLTALRNDVETARTAYEASSTQPAGHAAGVPLSVVTPAVGVAVDDQGSTTLEAAGSLLALAASLLLVAGRALIRAARRPHGAGRNEAAAQQAEPANTERIEPPKIAAPEQPAPPVAAPATPVAVTSADRPPPATGLAEVRRDMTSLRLKLEAYRRRRA